MGMKKSTFTYYSTKLYNYLKAEFDKVKSYLDTNALNIQRVEESIEENEQNISKNTDDIRTVSDKVDNIQGKIDNGDFDIHEETNVTGNIIKVNNIKQYTFKNVQAGEVIEIVNEDSSYDYIIQCFEQTSEEEPLTVKTIEVNAANKDLFEYDDRYVEIDDTGAHPKNHVDIAMDLHSATTDGMYVYVSHDTIPIELFDSIENLVSYEVNDE